MITGIDFNTLTFGSRCISGCLRPPACCWSSGSRRSSAGAPTRAGTCSARGAGARAVHLLRRSGVLARLIVAASLCIVALARPQARVVIVRKSGADIVILQDGSASMYVKDVKPDRWRRSVQFLRVFADALSWKGDRVALALFAHTVAPQVRLTKDPNSFFFFLDHLGEHSPFRLEDNPTWDTNIEEGHRLGRAARREGRGAVRQEQEPQGLRRHHRRPGVVGGRGDRPSDRAPEGIPVNVVGVGTIGGGMIPEAPRPTAPFRRRRSTRASIANRCARSRAPAAASTSSWATSRIATSRSGSSRASSAAP